MTLIELLLALLIAALVVSLLYSLYHTAATAARRQQQRMDGFLPPAEALEEISRDLACAFGPRGNEECILELQPPSATKPDGPRLSFCSLFLDTRARNIDWTEVRRVTYRLLDGEAGRKTLVRTVEPLAGPGFQEGPRTNLIVRGVERFDVRVFDGKAWVEEWPAENSLPLPQAVRIELEVMWESQPHILKTELYIPAGNLIKKPSDAKAGPDAPDDTRPPEIESASPPPDTSLPRDLPEEHLEQGDAPGP